MFYWILFLGSLVALLLIFWRRWQLTLKSLDFEDKLKKDDELARQAAEEEEITPQEEPSELELKRLAEQRDRDEKMKQMRAIKRAFKQADLHFSKNNYGLAEKYLMEVLSMDNDHLDANLKLGLIYLQQENLPRAEFFFQKLIDLKENPVYFSNLALVLYQQKRLEESAKLYEKAIAMDNKKAGRFVSLAYVYHELGELEKALVNFEEAYRLEPRNLDYLWTLVNYYEKFSRSEDMLRALRKILEIDPYNDKAKAKLLLLEEELATEVQQAAEDTAEQQEAETEAGNPPEEKNE